MTFIVKMIHEDLVLLSHGGEKLINVPLKDLPENVQVEDVLIIENGMFCYEKLIDES